MAHLNNQTASMELLRSSLQYINLDFLYDLVMGNTEFLQNVIRQFLKQFPGEMEMLKEAVAAKDLKQVSTLSHHIQSTVSVFGKETPFFRQLEKMEKMAQNKAHASRLTEELTQLFEYQQHLMLEVNTLMKANL